MTRIRARCPNCGDVELAPDEMVVHLAEDALDLVGTGSLYRFVCPHCAETVDKPADERIVQLLVTGGVAVAPLDAAAMARMGAAEHPESPPGGPAFTPDDVLDLHLLLARDDWFDELAALLG